MIQKFYDDCDAYSYSLDIDNKDDTNIQKYIFENVYKVLKELLNYNKYKEEVEIFCRIKTFESTDELTYLNSEILNYKLINDLQIIKRNNNFYAFNINDLKYIDYKDVWECQGYSSDENGNRISKENYSIEKFQKAKGSFNSNGNYSEEKIDYYKISL